MIQRLTKRWSEIRQWNPQFTLKGVLLSTFYVALAMAVGRAYFVDADDYFSFSRIGFDIPNVLGGWRWKYRILSNALWGFAGIVAAIDLLRRAWRLIRLGQSQSEHRIHHALAWFTWFVLCATVLVLGVVDHQTHATNILGGIRDQFGTDGTAREISEDFYQTIGDFTLSVAFFAFLMSPVVSRRTNSKTRGIRPVRFLFVGVLAMLIVLIDAWYENEMLFLVLNALRGQALSLPAFFPDGTQNEYARLEPFFADRLLMSQSLALFALAGGALFATVYSLNTRSRRTAIFVRLASISLLFSCAILCRQIFLVTFENFSPHLNEALALPVPWVSLLTIFFLMYLAIMLSLLFRTSLVDDSSRAEVSVRVADPAMKLRPSFFSVWIVLIVFGKALILSIVGGLIELFREGELLEIALMFFGYGAIPILMTWMCAQEIRAGRKRAAYVHFLPAPRTGFWQSSLDTIIFCVALLLTALGARLAGLAIWVNVQW